MQDRIQVEIQKLGIEPKITSEGVIWDKSRLDSAMSFSGASFFVRGRPVNWDLPVQKEVFPNGTFCYQLHGLFHCPFEPALLYKDGTPLWYVEGRMLLDAEIPMIKEILRDIRIAPLYINDPVCKYTAKWVLKEVQNEIQG